MAVMKLGYSRYVLAASVQLWLCANFSKPLSWKASGAPDGAIGVVVLCVVRIGGGVVLKSTLCACYLKVGWSRLGKLSEGLAYMQISIVFTEELIDSPKSGREGSGGS